MYLISEQRYEDKYLNIIKSKFIKKYNTYYVFKKKILKYYFRIRDDIEFLQFIINILEKYKV